MHIRDILAHWPREIALLLDETQSAAIALFDAAKHPLYLNAAARTLLGADENHDPEHDYLVAPTWETLLQTGSASNSAIYEGWITFDGPRLDAQSLWGRFWRYDDRLLLLAAYDLDELNRVSQQLFAANSQITNLQRDLARKNAELRETLADLRETQAMLIHAEKMNSLGQLTAGIAHEVNNPLAFVISNLESLKTACADLAAAYENLDTLVHEQGSPGQREHAAAIRQQADLDFVLDDMDDLLEATLSGVRRIQQLVASLGTFARPGEADRKSVDIAASLESTLAIAQPYLRDKVSVTVDLDDLPQIPGYPAELNQVFLNIIINAAQAIEDAGHLTIHGSRQDDSVVLRFTDTGHGMDDATRSRAFDPFFTTKPVGSGTGLGLSIVYRIVTEIHHGTITVSSAIDRGTTFTVRLPLGSDA